MAALRFVAGSVVWSALQGIAILVWRRKGRSLWQQQAVVVVVDVVVVVAAALLRV